MTWNMTGLYRDRRPAAALALVVVGAVLGACTDQSATPTELVVPVVLTAHAITGAHGTHMTGAEETPPRDTPAQGQLSLTPGPGGTLRYKLLVANIENVTQAHMHFAPVGFAGPPVVWLYPGAPPAQVIPGPSNGVLAEGIITDASLVGPLAGQGVQALLAAIRAGTIYANVHTQQFPPGEIRGQVN